MSVDQGTVTVGKVKIGAGYPLALIAGPCVIEGRDPCMRIAEQLTEFASGNDIPFVFKASYEKANRSSAGSYRGPGIDEGLKILSEIRSEFNVPVLTDVHRVADALPTAEVADVLQLPAFLCRQTDLAVALGSCGKPVNVKKGQFLAPWDMKNVVDKVRGAGSAQVFLTERGTCFGYNNLVADMRSLVIMRQLGCPVVFDATHSVQLPGGQGDRSGGDSKWAGNLARAAVGCGCDAVFAETHPDPAVALCDSDTMIPVNELMELWPVLRQIDEAVCD